MSLREEIEVFIAIGANSSLDRKLIAVEAILDRVHAECGPETHKDMYGMRHIKCKTCLWACDGNYPLSHAPNCLWRAVDELKRKAGST